MVDMPGTEPGVQTIGYGPTPKELIAMTHPPQALDAAAGHRFGGPDLALGIWSRNGGSARGLV
ncbi:hypothetical protein GCM10017556_24490 [Micromonospora sagamiensis]|nr:hypothetical protein GCM10017556_24490 [Micromonospora sagamiensis]